MIPRMKRDRFREWLSSFFTAKDTIRLSPDGPQRHFETGGFFNNADRYTMTNSTMISIQGDNNTVISKQGAVTQIMSLLSQHIIHGVAHDDSARDLPPHCHAGTRVKLLTRITTWFDGQARGELLLWITGPAGVGKSTIVQTFAEHLVKSRSLGALVSISRPNKRNESQGIFITIAYQLATQIKQYQRFIVKRLSRDSSLLNAGLAAQFSTFIVEPFVEKKIGVGGKRWGIILDGLDELEGEGAEGEGAQCEIIQLISSFAHEHRDVPLAWIIASRPESHISNTFNNALSHRTEYISIDSTEACEDVQHFLRSSFKTTQKKSGDSIYRDWPSDTDFLKLTAAASGLFIYAQVVMRFIGDPNYDPISRFQAVLSVIDRCNTVPTKENPFIQLDALYAEILSSIPSPLWPTAKQILGVTIHAGKDNLGSIAWKHFNSLSGIGLVFGIPRHVIYTCLSQCRSTLEIPDWKVAHQHNLIFLHASFTDYLKDSRRSGEFHIGSARDAEEAVISSVLEIWNKCTGDDTATVEFTWHQYCSQMNDESTSEDIDKFHADTFRDMIELVGEMVY